MKLKMLMIIVIMFCGCTVKTQIIKPGGDVYTIKSKSDAMVSMKSDNVEIIVDNKGKPNIFESLLGWLLLKTPDVVQAQ